MFKTDICIAVFYWTAFVDFPRSQQCCHLARLVDCSGSVVGESRSIRDTITIKIGLFDQCDVTEYELSAITQYLERITCDY